VKIVSSGKPEPGIDILQISMDFCGLLSVLKKYPYASSILYVKSKRNEQWRMNWRISAVFKFDSFYNN
jgi:hypothetical protein